MKISLVHLALLLSLGMLAPIGHGQDQTKPEEKAKHSESSAAAKSGAEAVIPIKVTVVFNEYDGDKKVSSLPYALFVKAGEEHNRYFGNMRVGVRVPVAGGGKDSQIQYQDVGSNIDCEARLAEDGRYLLDMRLERSSVYSSKNDRTGDQRAEEQPRPWNAPLLRTFRTSLALLMRDGQTMQSTVATDPLDGHTVRVDVTLNVLK